MSWFWFWHVVLRLLAGIGLLAVVVTFWHDHRTVFWLPVILYGLVWSAIEAGIALGVWFSSRLKNGPDY